MRTHELGLKYNALTTGQNNEFLATLVRGCTFYPLHMADAHFYNLHKIILIR